MNTYGYVRVSSQDQNEDRQMIAMREFGVMDSMIFLDKQSGKDFNRPQYIKMKETIQEGDLLVVKSIDRLGRSYEEIGEQWRILTKEKKIDIYVIEMSMLDTRRYKDLVGTFIADLVLQVLSFVSQNERENIRQRQAEGIAAARLKGVRFGRPRIQTPDCFDELIRRWRKGTLSRKEIENRCGISTTTFYRRVRSLRENSYLE